MQLSLEFVAKPSPQLKAMLAFAEQRHQNERLLNDAAAAFPAIDDDQGSALRDLCQQALEGTTQMDAEYTKTTDAAVRLCCGTATSQLQHIISVSGVSITAKSADVATSAFLEAQVDEEGGMLIDCTATGDTIPALLATVAAGGRVVSANKKPFASDYRLGLG